MKRSASSRQWLRRHVNDPFVQRSKKEGYRSRAAYKLIEIDERYKLLAKGKRVIDLGAAPGGWCQVAAKAVGSTDEAPLVAGIDILPVDPIPGVVLMQKDFLDDDAPDALMAAIGGVAPDLVLSDMAASTTGHRRTDHLRTVNLYEAAAAFAIDVLAPGGDFLAKVFQGGTEGELLGELKRRFETVHHVKPKASRAESVELYMLAKGFRGR